MFKNVIIPVQIKKVKGPKGRDVLKAAVPMNIIFEKDFDAEWLEEEMTRLEKRYLELVKALKRLLRELRSKKQKKGRVLLYWKFGDKIVEFIEQYKNSPLSLESLTKSLVRDVKASDKTIMRCKRFRALYPDVTKIDPNRSFDSYVATFEGGYISKPRRRRVRKNEKD